MVSRLTYSDFASAADGFSNILIHLDNSQQLSVPWASRAASGDFGVGLAIALHGNDIIQINDGSKGLTGDQNIAKALLKAAKP